MAYKFSAMSKANYPKPSNILKTRSALEGEKAGYMTAWKKLSVMTLAEKHTLVKGYKLIVPYLLKLQEMNTSSHANFEVNNNNHIKHFSSALVG